MNKFKDAKGKWLTQSLFLEFNYNEDSIYTLDEQDKEYKGSTKLSFKKLYLELEDVTEYEFANKYFGGWSHWKRLRGNKAIAKHIDEVQDELGLKLKAQGVRQIINYAKGDKGYQAAKWLVDNGWDQRKAGKPSKEEVEGKLKEMARESDEYSSDVIRLLK